MSLSILPADLDNPTHQAEVLELVNAYAEDPMGAGGPLAAEVRDRLIDALRDHPTTVILLARQGQTAVGIAVCFLGFSTFAARPLLNVHDLAVLPGHRGRGIGRRLLEAVEQEARRRDCCRVTLEVYEQNLPARQLYETLGFDAAIPEPGAETRMLFLTKRL